MITVNDIVAASHLLVAQHVGPGDIVVDATAGNGNDTLFLAKLAGPTGIVHAFDIQEAALRKTKALLEQNSLAGKVCFHLRDHRHIPEIVNGPVKAIMFNLGYLPGGDKSLVTSADNSLTALKNCLAILPQGGIISVVSYSGHPGGQVEEEQVASWCQGLNPREYSVIRLSLENKANNPPKLWLICRSGHGKAIKK